MGLFDSFFGKKKGSSPTKKGDGSPPAAEPGIEAAESAMPNVKKELESGIPALKPAEVNDRSGAQSSSSVYVLSTTTRCVVQSRADAHAASEGSPS